MKLTCAALLALAIAGCGSKERGTAKEDASDAGTVARLDDHHMLTAPVTVGNLTVWPVLTDRPLDLGEFLTLDEALAKGVAEVREAGVPPPTGQEREEEGARAPGAAPAQQRATAQAAEPPQQTLGEDATAQTLVQVVANTGASVNTLVIENRGDLPILVCAGTVVKGGNQDRQIGQDFVLKAKSTTPVDAFCVERGRWESDRLGQETGGKFQVAHGMATAQVRAKGQYEKDQGGVWQQVEVVASGAGRANEQNASSSLAVALDANAKASAEDLKRIEDTVTRRFAAAQGAVGFAYAVNGKPVAVRTFAHPRLLGKQLAGFVRGMATEALLAKGEAGKPAEAKDVVALVKRISASDEKVEETKGLNRNGLRSNEVGYNGTCYVSDKDGKLAPLTQDWTAR